MGATQVTIPTATGATSLGPVPIPDGILAARLEVILSDADFSTPHNFLASVRIVGDGIDQTSSADLQSISGGLGDPLFVCLSNPMAIVDGVLKIVPFPSGFVATLSVTCTDDSSVQVGGIVSFADSVDNLPATNRPVRSTG